MWPGPDPPAGPSDAGPSWARPSGPGAGWYLPPVLLLLAAVAGFGVALAFLADDARAGRGPRAGGDPAAGVPVRLSEGYAYFVYVAADEAAPFGCSVRADGRVRRVALTRRNSWSAPERPRFRYTATFVAPASGTALFRCAGTAGPIVVQPDGTACTYLEAAAFGAAGTCAVATVALLRRGAARRRAGGAGVRT